MTDGHHSESMLISHPQDPDARNATSLKEYYAGADITTSWFANALSLRKWDVKKSWDALLRPVNRLKWLEYGVRSYTVNARASRENNMIMMPATFGNLPFFDPGLPLYSQYGRTGYTVGHEIVHNFDTVGMRIDKERTTNDWLSTDSAAAFAERAECIREQYSRVPVVLANGRVLTDPQSNKALHVNGNKTLSENIADQGGLSIAYEAWKKAEAASARSMVPQLALPGLEAFSREQLFFITFGQSWCSRDTEEEMQWKVAEDRHAPHFARIRITPMNVEGFKKAWQCDDSAPVCKVW
jgi:endothelin-converting enzyme